MHSVLFSLPGLLVVLEILDAWYAYPGNTWLTTHNSLAALRLSAAARTRVILVSSRIFNAANLWAKSARNSICAVVYERLVLPLYKRCRASLCRARTSFGVTADGLVPARKRHVSSLVVSVSCTLSRLLLTVSYGLVWSRAGRGVSRDRASFHDDKLLPRFGSRHIFFPFFRSTVKYLSGDIPNWLVRSIHGDFESGRLETVGYICELERSPITLMGESRRADDELKRAIKTRLETEERVKDRLRRDRLVTVPVRARRVTFDGFVRTD